MKTEIIGHQVLEHLLAYFINADATVLSDDELSEVQTFNSESAQWAMQRPGYVSHHWSAENEYSDDFGRCEITQCFGNLATLTLVVMLEN